MRVGRELLLAENPNAPVIHRCPIIQEMDHREARRLGCLNSKKRGRKRLDEEDLTLNGKKSRWKREMKKSKQEKDKKFFARFPNLFTDPTCRSEKKVKEILCSEDSKEHLQEIYYTFKLCQNAIELVKSFSRETRSRYRSGILSWLCQGIPNRVAAKLFDTTVMAVKNAREHGKRVKSIQAMFKQKQKPFEFKNPDFSRVEQKYMRKWAGEKILETSGRGTGDASLRCDLAKPELRREYNVTGSVLIYSELAEHGRFKKRVDAYDRLIKRNPPLDRKEIEKKSTSLIRSMWNAREWKKSEYKTDRPADIEPRSAKLFWRALNARRKSKKGEKQTRRKYLPISWSRKVHVCPDCRNAHECFQAYRDLHNRLNHPSCPPQEKEWIRKHLDKIIQKLIHLKEHREKFECQRDELKKWEKEAQKNPGVVLVYEDFGSKEIKSGTKIKMSDFILTLVYWDQKGNRVEKEVKYLDTFSRGSLNEEDINDTEARGGQDKFLYRDAWLGWLKAGVFDDFHTIIISGDNGSSLKNAWSLYMMSRVWEKYRIRVLFFQLCQYHAWNRCDPHGGQIKTAMDKKERKIDQSMGCSEAYARTIKQKWVEGQFQNTMGVQAVEVPAKYNKWMPENIIHKKAKDQVFGIRSIGIVYPETNDIYDHKEHPTQTIHRTGINMVGTSFMTKQVAFLELREKALDKQKNWCMDCSQVFSRTVLKEEHDQKDYYRCPVTNTLTYETNLDRPCFHCTEAWKKQHPELKECSITISQTHIQGHLDTGCPSATLAKNGVKMLHKTFPARTIHGGLPEQLTILYEPIPLTQTDIWNLEVWYWNRNKSIKVNDRPEQLVETMVAIFRTEDNQINISESIPWAVGVCKKAFADKYLFALYEPIDAKNMNIWNMRWIKECKREVEVPRSCKALEFPVKLPKQRDAPNETGTLSTFTILRLARNIHFKWNLLDLPDKPDEIEVEAQDYNSGSSDEENDATENESIYSEEESSSEGSSEDHENT